MGSKRIYELAKDLGYAAPKDLLSKLEQLGIKGKKPSSTLSEDELSRLAGGAVAAAKPTPVVSAERVVGERLVTQRDFDGETTSREQILEARVQPNVIRRRAQRVEVVKQDLAESVPLPESTETADIFGPSDSDGDALLDLIEAAPSSGAAAKPAQKEAAEAPEPPPEAASAQIPAPTPAEAVAPVVASEPAAVPASAGSESVAVENGAPAIPPASLPPRSAPETEASGAQTARPAVVVRSARTVHTPGSSSAEPGREGGTISRPSRTTPEAPMLDDGMRRVQVLGKIDLKKAEPPPRPRPTAFVPGATTPGTAPAGEGGTAADEAARRRKGRKVIRKPGQPDPFGADRMRGGRKPLKKRAAPGKEQRRTEITTPSARKRIVRINEAITVGELAKAMGLKAGEVIKALMGMGVMATVNHVLDADHATLVAAEFEYNVENVAFDADKEIEGTVDDEDRGEATSRSPVVTIMGHVDHGKTSLLDAIRATSVAEGEAGGITQHIGAYTVDVRDRRICFLDTPGHEAFTAMRARGAKVTDIVILVVAADDGVMPQTVEAIAHSRAAEVPIIVAVNKIDKPEADMERVQRELADNGLVPEDWGGDTIFAPVSAKTHQGLDHLLDMILLQADVLDLKAHPAGRARGTIVEARLDRGRGPVATVLVREGTLKAGDAYICGLESGRVRAMLDSHGHKIDEAGPSTPVEILGLSGVPDAGEAFAVVADEATARQISEHRRTKQRQVDLGKSSKVSLDDLYKQIEKANVKELRVVLKCDVQGSIDALRDALTRLSTAEVRLSVLHASVGGVTESDVLLASASNAVIIGFNVRPEPKAERLAEREGVDLRLYTIIYDAVNQVREALEGLLEPTFRERTVGRAEVRQVFGISGAGVIAGCFVQEGKINRGASARLVRDQAVVHTGKVGSLRRFKDDVREVASGYECGIGLENYNDIKPGDVIEVFDVEEVARKIAADSGGNRAQLSERYA